MNIHIFCGLCKNSHYLLSKIENLVAKIRSVKFFIFAQYKINKPKSQFETVISGLNTPLADSLDFISNCSFCALSKLSLSRA